MIAPRFLYSWYSSLYKIWHLPTNATYCCSNSLSDCACSGVNSPGSVGDGAVGNELGGGGGGACCSPPAAPAGCDIYYLFVYVRFVLIVCEPSHAGKNLVPRLQKLKVLGSWAEPLPPFDTPCLRALQVKPDLPATARGRVLRPRYRNPQPYPLRPRRYPVYFPKNQAKINEQYLVG